MTHQADPKQPQIAPAPSGRPEPNFNFDQWAGAVKQQMLASLKRRGSS